MDSLEISVRSASGLKDLNTVGTMDPYVTVFLSNDLRSKQKTEVHTDGGKNPHWKGKPMRFMINKDLSKMQNVMLVFKIMAEKPFGDKEVGEVVVHINELLQVDHQVEKSLSYSVSTPSGKPKGTLNFSYKVVKNINVYNTKNEAVGYGPPMALGPGPSSYNPGHSLLPSPNPQPQYGVTPAPYPPQQPQHFQHSAGYYLTPPQGYPPQQGFGYPPAPSQGYPPQQGYGYPTVSAPPPGAYGYTHGGAPPPPGPYGYHHAQGYPSGPGNHQIKQGGKKPKSKAGGLLGLGALGIGAGLVGGMLLGGMVPDIGEMASGLGDVTSGFGDLTGDAVGDVTSFGGDAMGGAVGDAGGAFQGAYSDAGSYLFSNPYADLPSLAPG